MSGDEAAPVARVASDRSRWLWLVPAAALLVVLWAAWSAWRHRGVTVDVLFQEGHGIAAGDAVKHRGIVVGAVRDVALTSGGDGVLVRLALRPEAASLARSGARFWIVRPEIGFDRISGLDTIVGARYVAVQPPTSAAAPSRRRFVGLDQPPVVELVRPGDLEILVECGRRGSLGPGSPVTYRQVRVGVVRSVRLASDARSVEAHVHIDADYAPLVRAGTRFWDAGGIELGVGLKGLTAAVESPELLLRGGLAFATPPDAGPPARGGDRFRLAERVDEAWLRWQPSIALGGGDLPPGMVAPRPSKAHLSWRSGMLFASDRDRSGWTLVTARGVLAPAWIAEPPPRAREGSVALSVEGVDVPLPATVKAQQEGIVLLEAPAALVALLAPWPAERVRRPASVEDCIVVSAPDRAAIPLSEGRLAVEAGGWRVDPEVALDALLEGAIVVSRRDGAVIGLLAIDEAGAIVRLAPEAAAAAPALETTP